MAKETSQMPTMEQVEPCWGMKGLSGCRMDMYLWIVCTSRSRSPIVKVKGHSPFEAHKDQSEGTNKDRDALKVAHGVADESAKGPVAWSGSTRIETRNKMCHKIEALTHDQAMNDMHRTAKTCDQQVRHGEIHQEMICDGFHSCQRQRSKGINFKCQRQIQSMTCKSQDRRKGHVMAMKPTSGRDDDVAEQDVAHQTGDEDDGVDDETSNSKKGGSL